MGTWFSTRSRRLQSAAAEPLSRVRVVKPPDGQPVSLDQLKAGQSARIQAIQGTGPVIQRLFEMGLIDGEPVEVVGFAPLGDPMEIRLRDYRLSLRRQEAACI